MHQIPILIRSLSTLLSTIVDSLHACYLQVENHTDAVHPLPASLTACTATMTSATGTASTVGGDTPHMGGMGLVALQSSTRAVMTTRKTTVMPTHRIVKDLALLARPAMRSRATIQRRPIRKPPT